MKLVTVYKLSQADLKLTTEAGSISNKILETIGQNIVFLIICKSIQYFALAQR